jgi:hypothetical protein
VAVGVLVPVAVAVGGIRVRVADTTLTGLAGSAAA